MYLVQLAYVFVEFGKITHFASCKMLLPLLQMWYRLIKKRKKRILNFVKNIRDFFNSFHEKSNTFRPSKKKKKKNHIFYYLEA